jgi:hypothetical protein
VPAVPWEALLDDAPAVSMNRHAARNVGACRAVGPEFLARTA